MDNVVRRTVLVVVAMLAFSGARVAADGSPAAETGRNVAVVEPSACEVAPRTDADPLGDATPEARVSLDSEADLPQGEPASQEQIDLVVGIERVLAACINADAPLQVASLLTDEAAALFLADLNVSDGGATPDPALNQTRLTLLAVRDVRVFDDGRLGAVVVWVLERADASHPGAVEPELEANFHIYEEVDEQWLLAEELSGFNRQTRIIPADGGGWELDPDVFGTPYLYESDATPAA